MIMGKVSISPVKLPVVLVGRRAYPLYSIILVYQPYGHTGVIERLFNAQ